MMKKQALSVIFILLVLLVINQEVLSKSCDQKCPVLTQSDMDSYIHSLTGPIISPRDASYRNASLLQNRRMSKDPGLIVYAQSSADVQKSILFAKKFRLKLAIQGTGHSYVGRSTVEGGLLLVMSKLKKISINLNSTRSPDGEVTVETGLMWGEVYQEVDKYGRVVVGGADPSVGMGGYTLGGGHSPVTRSLGLAVDNLVEATLIVADGRKVTVSSTGTTIQDLNGVISQTSSTDLFWALRGGGGSTFGVVITLTFKLHHPPNGMFAAVATFPMYTPTSAPGAQVLKQLYQYTKTMDSSFGGYLIYNTYPYSAINFGVLTAVLVHYGAETAALEKQMADLLAGIKVKPYSTVINKYQTFWDYEKNSRPDLGGARVYLYNSLLQNDTDYDALVDTLVGQAIQAPKNTVQACTNTIIGGAMNKVSHDETSISPGFRSATHSMSCALAYTDPTLDGEVRQKGQEFGNQLKKFGKAVYFNEPVQDMLDWKEESWGSNYGRLLNIKKVWDPEHLFWCWHCVGSDLPRKEYCPICVQPHKKLIG